MEIIYSDVAGPFAVASTAGNCYFTTFIDAYTDKKWVRFLKHKSGYSQEFKKWHALVTTETGLKVGTLHSDRGGEYISSELEDWLQLHGIKHNKTAAHSPHQNGVAEWYNRTLVESAHTSLIHASLPSNMWAEAINHSNEILNAAPSKKLSGSSSYIKWFNKPFDVSNLHVFGCWVEALDPSHHTKLAPKTFSGRYLGPATDGPGYKVWNPSTKHVSITRSAHFFDFKCPTLPAMHATPTTTTDITH